MYLSPPTRDPVDDYERTITRRRSEGVSLVLQGARNAVLAAYNGYANAAADPTAYSSVIKDKVIAKVLRENYDLVQESRILSDLREEILEAAFINKCALCGFGEVGSLDHYLPKNRYPEYSILPYNLLPACGVCNLKKLQEVGDTEGGRFLHSYLDRFESVGPLITCEITTSGEELVIKYAPRDSLPEKVKRIVRYHFKGLDLQERYTTASLDRILGVYDLLEEAYHDEGPAGVAYEAKRRETNCQNKFGNQYWEVALYRGMQISEDFCNKGFELVRKHGPDGPTLWLCN